ncbi:TIMELESS-interacting protein [Tribolium madens]|uniref:TIMELESS-interacting protein n=1 Tax=Tribolium madens TaxID=41895 RepID=UPI001CF754A0|nr:TIMELESS-interacting protein [Tribolium madens]XP_044264290.1 TIMELESS-interacting protein [Tribolium madens]
MSSSEDSDLEIIEEVALERFEENADEGNIEEQAEEAPGENNENEAESATASKPVKARRVIRNPQPKLNAERLKGPRGLSALESHFDRVKYKGKGYEEQDLGVILKTYEYWCHRLFPKYPFSECIAKIEQLGSKKAVVTHIKRIRYDLLCEDSPIINNDNDSEPEPPEENQFDAFPASLEVTQPEEPELTEEQLEIIRINKERAERIRKERMIQRTNESQNPASGSLTLASQDEFPDDQEMEEMGRSEVTLPMPSEEDFPSDQEIRQFEDKLSNQGGNEEIELSENSQSMPKQNNLSKDEEENISSQISNSKTIDLEPNENFSQSQEVSQSTTDELFHNNQELSETENA